MAFVRNYSTFLIKNRLRTKSVNVEFSRNISNRLAPVLLCSNFQQNKLFLSSVQNSTQIHFNRYQFLYGLSQRSLSTSHHYNSEFDSSKDLFAAPNIIPDQSSSKVIFLENEPVATSTELISDASPVSFDPSLISQAEDIATTLSADLSTVVSEVVEPTLSSLGLVNYTPVGLVQACLEYLHIGFGLPWWSSILLATAIARLLMFPLFVKTQRNAARLSNYMPQVQFLQAKFSEARRTGNSFEASRAANELMGFMKKHDINPLKTAAIPLFQAPVFLSFFLALRSMSKLPVESLKVGGIAWFTDLTIPDPYYTMPLLACSTLFVILKIGAESGMRMENMKMSRYLVGALPIIAFPFCINFQAAVLVYWCTNNLFTLLLVLLVKYEPLRIYLNIPKRRPVDKNLVMPKKGFVEGFRDAMDDQKILKLVEDRKRLDDVRFRKSGTGPIPRTYSYDPTKPRPANAAAAAARQHSTKS